MKYDNERRDKDWINPPEPREEVELDVDSINDDKWLREREKKMKQLKKQTRARKSKNLSTLTKMPRYQTA